MKKSKSRKILDLINTINTEVRNKLIKWGWSLRFINSKKHKTKLTISQKRNIRKFWFKYSRIVSPKWSAYFSYSSEIVDHRYLPESLYYAEILPKLNNYNYSEGLSDKNYFDLLFDAKQPETLLRKIDGVILNNNYEIVKISSIEKMLMGKKIVFKPSRDSYGGSGVIFMKVNEDNFRNLEEIIIKSDNYIIQEELKQSRVLAEIHPESLNTIRLVTLLWKDEIHPLSAILRMGTEGSRVDNFSSGGIICPILENGQLAESGVQSNQSVLQSHPSGLMFKDIMIPNYELLLETAKKNHLKIPHNKLISWDFAIDSDNNVVLIEANFPSGQLDLHQLNNGPFFQDFTDEVLGYVYQHEKH